MNLIRSPLTWVVLLFSAPLALAVLLHHERWYRAGAGAGGQWMTVSEPLMPASGGHWQVGYRHSSACEQACLQSLHLAQRVILTVGRLGQYVDLSLLQVEEPAASVMPDGISVSVSAAYEKLAPETLYIADPTGLVLLSYPMSGDAEQDRRHAALLKRDLTRLLKNNMREG